MPGGLSGVAAVGPRVLAAALILGGLSACQQWNIPFLDRGETDAQQTQPSSEDDETGPDAEPSPDAVTLGKIVTSLQAGKSGTARRQLDRYLQHNPDSPTARDLMRQLDADPQQYFGDESFEYRVKPGDALADIAAEHLGDPLKFYMLARYNDIDRPELLYPGQILHIPGSPASPNDERGTEEPLRKAERYLAMNEFERALRVLQDIDAPAKASTLRGQAYRGLIRARLTADGVEEARDWLHLALQQRPESGAWQDWLKPLGNRTRVAYWRKIGETAYSEDRKLDALQAYRKAAGFAWDVKATQARLKEIRRELVREYHQAALINYRNQRLDRAIALWTQALDVDPDFERARVYRERARELKQRLQGLESGATAVQDG